MICHTPPILSLFWFSNQWQTLFSFEQCFHSPAEIFLLLSFSLLSEIFPSLEYFLLVEVLLALHGLFHISAPERSLPLHGSFLIRLFPSRIDFFLRGSGNLYVYFLWKAITVCLELEFYVHLATNYEPLSSQEWNQNHCVFINSANVCQYLCGPLRTFDEINGCNCKQDRGAPRSGVSCYLLCVYKCPEGCGAEVHGALWEHN